MSPDPESHHPERWSSDPGDRQTHHQPAQQQRPGIPAAQVNPSITDPYADVLDVLSPQARRGLVAQLAVGFYEGWRPGRAEVADLVAVKLGILSVDECERRKQLRDNGYQLSDLDLTRAFAKTTHPPVPRSADPRDERDYREPRKNSPRPGELADPEPPHQEGKS